MTFVKKKKGKPPVVSECTGCKLTKNCRQFFSWRKGWPITRCKECQRLAIAANMQRKAQEAVEVGLATPIAEPKPLSPRETSHRTGVKNYERVCRSF